MNFCLSSPVWAMSSAPHAIKKVILFGEVHGEKEKV